MDRKSLFWALAAAAGILYLATQAAQSKLPATQPVPAPEPDVPLQLLPLSLAAPDLTTAGTVTPRDLLQDRYVQQFRDAVVSLDNRVESGLTVQVEGPVYEA